MIDLEDHYPAVVERLVDGKVTPFLGAGVNLALPGRPNEVPWERGKLLPSGSELAQELVTEFDYPLKTGEQPDLLRVAQFASLKKDPGALYDWLRDLFDGDYPPTPVHEFFARLPGMLREKGYPRRNLLIVTTNYDDALERAFAAAGEPCDVVWYAADGPWRGLFWQWPDWPNGDPPEKPIEDPTLCRELSTERRTVILKIHGAVDRKEEASERDSFVITEDHYIDYLTKTDLSRVPLMLAKTLRTTSFLFLGYSLSDWNMRAFMHRIWNQRNVQRMSWSIQFDASDLEKTFWANREVEIHNISLVDYIGELERHVSVLEAIAPAVPAA